VGEASRMQLLECSEREDWWADADPVAARAPVNTPELHPDTMLTLEQYMAVVLTACPPDPDISLVDTTLWNPTVADDLRSTYLMAGHLD
jgi:hypothetical protein